MKQFLLIFLLFIISRHAFAISDSTHIDLALLHYSSNFEKEQFTTLNKGGNFNLLNFLFCLDSTVNKEKADELIVKMNRFFDEKLAPLTKNKNQDKGLKQLFKEMHDKLLNKYVTNARFEKLLDGGEYNCVTASALYALAFERFHIPYQLRSTTDHVYVIANPGPGETVIETTDPVNGAFQYSDQYKKAFVEHEVKHKMISKEEYVSNSVDNLFKKYFFTSDTIDFKQLIGYHYYNNGLDLMTKENYYEATNQLMKAYTLNRSKKVEYLLIVSLSAELNKLFDIADSGDVQKYFLLEKLYGETDNNFLYGKYAELSEELALRQDDLPRFDRISAYLFGQMTDSTELEKCRELYYLQKGTNYYDKHNFTGAYENFLMAYCLNSKDVRIKAAFDQIEGMLPYYEEEDSVADSLTAILERNSMNCPNVKHPDVKFKMVLTKAAKKFRNGYITEGDALLTEAEQMADSGKYKLTLLDHEAISEAYAAAQTQYYTKYNIPKAKEYVLRGLKLDPGNERLTELLGTLNKFKGAQAPPPPRVFPSTPGPNTQAPVQPRTVIVRTNSQ